MLDKDKVTNNNYRNYYYFVFVILVFVTRYFYHLWILFIEMCNFLTLNLSLQVECLVIHIIL